VTETTTELRPYSVSSIDRYLRCPRQWALRYRGDPEDQQPRKEAPEHLRKGTALHAGMETAFRLAMEATSPPTPGVKMDVYREQAVEALRASWIEQGLPRTFGTLDDAIGVLTRALEALPVLPPEAILGVEIEMREDTPAGHPFVLYIDVAFRTGDTLRIWDWKNSRKLKTPAALAADVQTNTYAHFLLAKHPWATRVLIGNYSLPLRNKVELVSEPSWREAATSRVDAVIGWIEADEVFAPRVSDACGECYFKPECPAWNPNSPYGEIRSF